MLDNVHSGVLQDLFYLSWLFDQHLTSWGSRICRRSCLAPVHLSSANFNRCIENSSSIEVFPTTPNLKLNRSKCPKCMFTYSQPEFSMDSSADYSGLLPVVYFINHVRVNVTSKIRWCLLIPLFVGELRPPSSYIRELQQLESSSMFILLSQSSFTDLSYYSSIFRCKISEFLFTKVPFIFVKKPISLVADGHIESSIKFFHKT